MRHQTTAQTKSKNACSNSSSYMLASQSCLPAQMLTQMKIANLKVAMKVMFLINVN